jgi:predicted nicotinamide N-methyase
MDIRPTDLPLQPVAGVPEVRLHQAVDLLWLWEHAQRADADAAAFPFWATPWAGGVGLARHVLDHPDEVAGRRVWDVATGSGLVAIAAALAGAAQVLASDRNPDALVATSANAVGNRVDIATSCVDALAATRVEHEVVLIGDACYDAEIAAQTRAFLPRAAATGARVLLGDPGRPDLPRDVLTPVAGYEIPDAAGLESTPLVHVQVWTPA